MSAIPELGPLGNLTTTPLGQAIGWALLQFVWQGALIAAVAAVVLFLLRRSAADVRYVVATIAMSLMLTVPIVTAVQGLAAARRAAAPAVPSAASTPVDVPSSIGTSFAPKVPATFSEKVPATDSPGAQVPATFPAKVPGTFGGGVPAALATWLLLGWAVGVLFLTLRLFSGWMWVRHLRTHGALAARASILESARRLARRLHVSRTLLVLESSIVDVPTVVGWLRPIILLPASALSGLSPVQLEAVLAHEIAHIRRHDYLVNLLQTLVETLLFYHPAVWWVSKQIRVERENCCDDLAVSLCGDPVEYAQALADLEQLRAPGGRLATLTMAANGGSLLHRVRRLLGAPSHEGRGPGWLAGAVCVLLIVTIAGIVVGAIDRQARQAAGQDQQSEDRSAGSIPDAIQQTATGVQQGADALRRRADELRRSADDLRRDMDALLRSADEIRRDAEDLRRRTPSAADVLRDVTESFTRDVLRGARTLAMELHEAFPQIPPPPPLPPLPAEAHEPPPPAEWPSPPEFPAAPEFPSPPEFPAAPGFPAPPEFPSHPELPAPPEFPSLAAAPLPPEPASQLERPLPLPPAIAPAPPVPPALHGPLPRAPHLAPLPPPAAPRSGGGVQGSTLSRQRSSGNFTWSNDGEKLQVNYRGEIEFTDDDVDVKSLSPGGWLRIRRTSKGESVSHTVEFQADGSGNIERKFWAGSAERPFDPEGRKWLAQVLPRFIRQTGIGAPARVARIYKSKGPQGVLAEISLIEGSWAKRTYFSEFLKTPGLDGRTVQQALAQAGREIDSDFELASLLISADRLLTLDDATRKAYLEAARTIESDFEMRRVFSSALKKGPMPPAALMALLDGSMSIGSDFEQASLLVDVAKESLDDTNREAFFKAVGTIDSDFEQRRVLSAVMKRQNVSPAVVGAVLESARTLESDFENAALLLDVVKNGPIEGALRDPFFRAVASIGSTFERGRVLQAVAKRTDASDETILEAIKATQGMGNFEAAQVLLVVARTHTLKPEARDAYIDAADKLGNFEQGRVLSALAKSEPARR
jgi:beta-lactamase regulating signal transducer with metallopeptidase domain